MKNRIIYTFIVLLTTGAVLTGCSSDDDHAPDEFVIGFKHKSIDLSSDKDEEVVLEFSGKAPQDGSIELNYDGENVAYGDDEDFTTQPSGKEGTLSIPIEQGGETASFTIKKLKDALPGEDKAVEFEIEKINIEGGVSGGNTSTKVAFSESASMGGSIKPEVGGPNQPNQVYVSLKSEEQTVVKRDAWDLGFYGGDQSRVVLNTSLKMFAGETKLTNIDKVSENDVEDLMPKIALLAAGSDKYVDDPKGNINKTAIAEISENDDENPVYIINLGNEIGDEKPETGSVAVDKSDPDEPEKGKRGWKKVRILREGDDYIMQYADLDDSNHEEVTISKDQTYNFTFFNFADESTVEVEPPKDDWDLNFTTFTNILDDPESDSQLTYGFSDYVVFNNLSGVMLYKVSTEDIGYDDFVTDHIEENDFSKDRTLIGDDWRDVFEHEAKDDRFYILKDAESNIYKIKFTSMVNEDGERGYPTFDYELVE